MGHVMTRRSSKKKSQERGRTALVVSVIAVALLAGTWLYVHRQLSEGRDAHVGLHLVLADVCIPLLALWLVWDWVRYRRGIQRGKSKSSRKC